MRGMVGRMRRDIGKVRSCRRILGENKKKDMRVVEGCGEIEVYVVWETYSYGDVGCRF